MGRMKGTYLYIITCQRKYLKVGVADDPHSRLSTFQTGNPHELLLDELVLCKSRKSAYGAESECHKKCKRFRKRGEWFNYTRFNKEVNSHNPSKDYIFSLLLKIVTIRGEQSNRLTVIQWPKHEIVDTERIRDEEKDKVTGEHHDILTGTK